MVQLVVTPTTDVPVDRISMVRISVQSIIFLYVVFFRAESVEERWLS